jgi:hypothetical protein
MPMTRIRMVDSAAPTTSIVSPSITAVTTYGAEVSVVGAGALLEVDGRGGCCLTSSLG